MKFGRFCKYIAVFLGVVAISGYNVAASTLLKPVTEVEDLPYSGAAIDNIPEEAAHIINTQPSIVQYTKEIEATTNTEAALSGDENAIKTDSAGVKYYYYPTRPSLPKSKYVEDPVSGIKFPLKTRIGTSELMCTGVATRTIGSYKAYSIALYATTQWRPNYKSSADLRDQVVKSGNDLSILIKLYGLTLPKSRIEEAFDNKIRNLSPEKKSQISKEHYEIKDKMFKKLPDRFVQGTLVELQWSKFGSLTLKINGNVLDVLNCGICADIIYSMWLSVVDPLEEEAGKKMVSFLKQAQ